jgi:colanic acid/amylovoran biosynthesis glycosyltransferase
MRVVQFCGAFSVSSQTFIYDTVTEMDRQGIDCHVVAKRRVNEENRPYKKVHTVNVPGRWNLPRLWYRALATFGIRGDVETHKWPVFRSRLRRALDRLDPDVVHAQFGPKGVMVAPVTEALNIPLVVTFHGYDISILPRQKKVRRRYRELFERADALIGVSDHNSSRLMELGAPIEKVRTIHNGSRLDQFTYSNPLDRFDGRTVGLLHVGRLVEKKGPLELVNAFSRARERVDGQVDLELTIAGDGPLREPLLRRIEELSLEEEINYAGSVRHEEVRRLLQRSHLYTQHCKTASNGDIEGQGVTFIEAQASGLPVVATQSGGVPSVVVDGEIGYLVPEEDVEAMADRITHLVHHPEKWEPMGRAGRQHVEEQFDLTKQVQKLARLYDEVS